MKKLIYIICITLFLASCDNGFEELNVNPTKPVQVAVGTKLTAVQKYISSERYDNWRANLIYQSTMMQHFAATAGYWSGDKYTWNRGYASSLMDRYYSNAVKSLEDLRVQLNDEGAADEMKAIVRILRVYTFSRLTDLYGDIPYSEAGKGFTEGILKPKYDAQSEIYPDLLKELEESAAALGSGTSGFGSADVIYQGDQGKWKRLANSLMLRLGLRLIKVDAAAAQAWATKAINGGVMQSNDDIFYLRHEVTQNRNGNSEVFDADGNPRMSKTFIDFLQAGNDPRLPILAARRSDQSTAPADLQGLPNGLDAALLLASTGEDNTDAYAEPNRSILAGFDAPMIFQTYAEVEFMLAEANVRWGLGGAAATSYNNGVTAAMEMLSLYSADAVIPSSDIANYLANNPYNVANALEQINTQYWAATFLNEYETFANWRRTGFPVLTPVNYPGNETNGTIPRRLTYTESEATNNADNYAAAIAAQGPDELTTRVWWDQ
ncbi:MAG: SusD/RagB family nutrient-binding outer membrane lipoprotein [Polaribacter sp.]